MTQTMNPVSHIERWGFVVLMNLPATLLGGIFATLRPRLRDFRFTPTICGVFRKRRIKKYSKVAVVY